MILKDKRPPLPMDVVDLKELPRPIHSRSYTMYSGTHFAPHTHSFAQFLFARAGNMRIAVNGTSWVIPTLYGMWIQANIEHEVWALDDVFLESLDVQPDVPILQQSQCRVLLVNNVVRELIHHVTLHVPRLYDIASKDDRLLLVLLELIEDLPEAQFALPWPLDERWRKLCFSMQNSPHLPHTQDECAKSMNMSERTFSRHFSQQTGMPFNSWKQRMRLLQGIVMLRQHKPVTEVALNLGYSSTSAFTYAFRQLFGVPPSRFEF
ncbi:helix-turn-helix transcriptional regulator [Buttiauxella selenatireducens]|uniref:Arabinose operon regulatory protein n=1 Tax=Buttiauxella selenatireducens TaxID=3073902 RepID=A0ABY9S9H6_9ENTR|nr:helix-turn-helix transcriptional regulator [Buttiauxella sp. R73]WMY74082.1 helix-turn-helix transcriptional regulator [Buttiauxella sp. R73]